MGYTEYMSFIAYAQTSGVIDSNVTSFSNNLLTLVFNPLIALITFFTLFIFIVLVIKFIVSSSESVERKNEIKRLLVIILILFGMSSIWVILNFFAGIGGSDLPITESEINVRGI